MDKREAVKAKITDRVEGLIDRLENSNIQADEVPVIFDAAWDVVESTIKAAQDGRLTFAEVGMLWGKLSALRTVVAAARKD